MTDLLAIINERDNIMIIVECLIILIWLIIVPFLIGTLIIKQLFGEEEVDILLALLCGVLCMLAVFYILVIPMLFSKIPLHILIIGWSIMMICLCGLSLIFNMKHFMNIFIHNFNKFTVMPWFTLFIIILIVAQTFMLVFYQHEDADDSFYVAFATTAMATDTIFQYDPFTGLTLATYPANYALSPFPIFVALLAKLLMIHPAIVAHTILPAFLIPFSYIVMAVLGMKLFHQKTSAVLNFLMFLCVLNIFGNVSVYTNSTFMLFRIWQGKAILANIILPAILYFSMRAMPGDKKFVEWMMLFACALSACLVSSMGIILAFIMIGCIGLVFSIQNRKIQTLIYSILCCTPCIVGGIVRITCL